MTDLVARLDCHWASSLGCSERRLRDGRRHVVSRPVAASQGSPWPVRDGSVCLFTTGRGWVLSVPDDLVGMARPLCLKHAFADLVRDGDRLAQAWFDRGETSEQRGADRGDEAYQVMNSLAASLRVRGWSHYIHWYCDSAPAKAGSDEHVRRITPDQPLLWSQWESWPGLMVGPRLHDRFEITDAFGYLLGGRLVSAAQLEASAADLAWEYGVETLPEFRGRGFATAVLEALTAFIIDEGRIAWHYCDHYNRPSRRLPEKLGYVRYAEGLFSHSRSS